MDKSIIIHPIISERATDMASRGMYVFKVQKHATKPEIKKALHAAYNVDAVAVRTVMVKAKKRRLGRSVGIKPGYKKAFITLKDGQTLDVLPHS